MVLVKKSITSQFLETRFYQSNVTLMGILEHELILFFIKGLNSGVTIL